MARSIYAARQARALTNTFGPGDVRILTRGKTQILLPEPWGNDPIKYRITRFHLDKLRKANAEGPGAAMTALYEVIMQVGLTDAPRFEFNDNWRGGLNFDA